MKVKNLPSDQKHYGVTLRFLSKLKGNKKLIEVGAGQGVLRDRSPKNIEYYSVDMGKGHDYQFDLNEGKMPIKDKTFDVLVCLETLEHVLYPERVIKEFKRITKDNAIFILSMPNEYNFWQRIMYLFAIKSKTNMPFKVIEENLHIHTPRVTDIISFFSKHLNILDIKYVWQSRKSYRRIIRGLDKYINVLAQISPSLFSRVVIVLARKK